MTVFPTPNRINVIIRIDNANINIVASKRQDAAVTVEAQNVNKEKDVEAAKNVIIELVNNVLHVKTTKTWQRFTNKNKAAVNINLELPTGSSIATKIAVGTITCKGELGDAAVKTGKGNINVEHVNFLLAKTSFGDITVTTANDHMHNRRLDMFV